MEVSPKEKFYKKAKTYKSLGAKSKETFKRVHKKAAFVKEKICPTYPRTRLADTSLEAEGTPDHSMQCSSAYVGPAAASPALYSPFALSTPGTSTRVCKTQANERIRSILTPKRRPFEQMNDATPTPERVKINRQMNELAFLTRRILTTKHVTPRKTVKRLI